MVCSPSPPLSSAAFCSFHLWATTAVISSTKHVRNTASSTICSPSQWAKGRSGAPSSAFETSFWIPAALRSKPLIPDSRLLFISICRSCTINSRKQQQQREKDREREAARSWRSNNNSHYHTNGRSSSASRRSATELCKMGVKKHISETPCE